MVTQIITEAGLDAFRAGRFSVPSILDVVCARVATLLNVAPGVGKSSRADGILEAPLTYARYDAVIYAAPSWKVIRERRVVLTGSAPVPFVVLHPRPRERCGDLDAPWTELEAAGCAAHAKATLCARCPLRDACDWPDRLSEERLRGVRLILMTEQHLLANPRMIRLLKRQTGARRVLLVLDEARFLDAPFTVELGRAALKRFHDTLQATPGLEVGPRDRWLRSLELVITGADPREHALAFPGALMKHAAAIQAVGVQRHGARFRFVGHQLADYHRSRPGDRWVDAKGALRFELLPALEGDTLILSAYLEAAYVAHRLDIDHVGLPLGDCRVCHSRSRIFNIKSRLGMEAYFENNSPQVLDFFATLIASNVRVARTTVAVTRKKFAELCIQGLTERLAKLGLDVRFCQDGFDALGPPDPMVVPVVTYGLVGINSLSGYDSAVCLNGFYVSPDALDAAVQGAVPERYRVDIEVEVDGNRNRRVRVAEPLYRDGGFEAVANACLRKLELEPVLQAAARVRFSTRPREVWLFEMHDARSAVGDVTEVFTLEAAYAAARLPKFKALLRARDTERLRALMAEGLSMRAAAEALGINRQTASRRLRECHKSPLLDLKRGAL